MLLRPAHPSDEPAIADICTRAFFDEDLFGRVMHPHRAQYPADVQIFWHEFLRGEWTSSRNKILVAVVTDEDQQEKIIGTAIWQRQGDDAGAQSVMREWTDPGPWPTADPGPNRALDPANKTILHDAEPFTKHYWAGPCASNWYLALCAVDPRFQGRHCGQRLVKWGLDRAREEGVRASVMASDGSDGFYLKCGFDDVVGNANEGEENPLKKAEVKGGSILFMWVKGGDEAKAA